MKRIVLFLLLAGALMGFFACQNPLAPETGESSVEDSAEDPGKTDPVLITPFAENDPETGQAVFVSAQSERIAIASSEVLPDTDELVKVACKEMSDYVLLDKPDDVPDSETWAMALVIGMRDDGKPGIWEIHNDLSVHPIATNGGRYGTTELADSDERPDGGMRSFFGWTYYPLMFSDDVGIIVGYAENENGFTSPHGSWAIEPGTKVGVYWSVHEDEHGTIVLVSRAKAIATPIEFPFMVPEEKWGRYSYWWRRFWQVMENRFKIFFLTWVDRYITVPETVEIADAAEGTYWISGPDDKGVASLATVTKHKVLSIEDGVAKNGESDYEVIMQNAPTSVNEGEPFSFTYRILYGGNVPSPPSAVAEYISLDDTFDSSDTFIRSIPVEGLMDGEYRDSTASTTIDVAGTYYVLAVIDPDDVVEETDEDNNVTTSMFTVQAPPPPNAGIDLVPGTPYYTDPVSPGETVTVLVPVENTGADPANNPFNVDVYLLTDTNLDLTGLTPFTEAFSGIVPGGTAVEVPVVVNFNGYTNGNGVIIYADVDTTDTISETDETNNANTITTVGGKMIGAGPFSVDIVTFATGENDDGTPEDVDTYLTIYKNGDSSALVNTTGVPGKFAAYTVNRLNSGDVLHVLVRGAQIGGPYGFIARALNQVNPTNFPEILNKDADPGEPESGDETQTTGGVNLVVGGGMSRYTVAGFGDEDWFHVVIP